MHMIRSLLFPVLMMMALMTSCTHASNQTERQYQYRQKHVKAAATGKKHVSVTKPQVVIDAGHGGYDLGAHSRVCEEKDVCLKTAQVLKKYLLQKGYRVVMTRTRDEFVPLKKRAQIANISKSQLLVSIHYNAAKSERANGVEIYYYDSAEPWKAKRSKQLAQLALSRIISKTGAHSRGVKGGNFCVIRETKMPSILVEGGFITNPQERGKICDAKYIDKIATALADSIDQYFKK